MKDKESILQSGLLEQYVLGLTTPEQNREVESYAQAYPEIQKELEAMQNAIEQYALQYSIPPARSMKDDILSEIEAFEASQQLLPNDNKRTVNPWVAGAIAACMGLLLFTSLNLYKDNQNLNRDVNKLTAQYETFKSNCEKQKAKQQEDLKLFAVLKDNETLPVRLQGTTIAPTAEAVVYWNQDKEQAFLNVINLPEPPKDKVYQIWADVAGEMIDMGVFKAENELIQDVKFIANAESFNITLEPKGGSKHPTVELLQANGRI